MQSIFDALAAFFNHRFMRAAPIFVPIIMIIARDSLPIMIICAVFIPLQFYIVVTEVLLHSVDASVERDIYRDALEFTSDSLLVVKGVMQEPQPDLEHADNVLAVAGRIADQTLADPAEGQRMMQFAFKVLDDELPDDTKSG